MSTWTVVGVPMYTLARYSGMGASPAALRKSGVLHALRGATVEAGDVILPPLESDTREGGVFNLGAFVDGTRRTARWLSSAFAGGTLLAVGGECSMVVGELTALKSKSSGRPGVVWIDSHGDFNTPVTSPSGYIGGMCLAFACGMGPPFGSLDTGTAVEPKAVLHLGGRAFDLKEERAMMESGMG